MNNFVLLDRTSFFLVYMTRDGGDYRQNDLWSFIGAINQQSLCNSVCHVTLTFKNICNLKFYTALHRFIVT